MPASDVAKTLAAQLTPLLVQRVEEHRSEIIANASPAPVRLGLSLGWNGLLREIQPLTESACDAVLDKFGGMTISEMAALVVAHTHAKGRVSHSSFYDMLH